MAVDTLVTKYTLDPSGYRSGAASVSAITKGLGSSLQSLIPSDPLAMWKLIPKAAGAMFAGVAAEAGIAKVAFDKFLAFDEMVEIFGGALGSLDRGKSVMKGLEEYASKSAFSLNALASASQQLVVGGLDLQRYVPLMERFALAVSGTDPNGLNQVAGAFLRIKGGSFGEAMEIFRKAGISSNDLRGQGIKVTKAGEIQSSSEELFAALERIAGQGSKIAGVVESLTSSNSTKVSNTYDAFDRAMVRFGETVSVSVMPVLESLTSQLNEATKDGTIEALGRSFTGLFNSIGGEGGLSGAVDSAAVAIFMFNGVVYEAIKTLSTIPGFGDPKDAMEVSRIAFDIYKKVFTKKPVNDTATEGNLNTGDSAKSADPIVTANPLQRAQMSYLSAIADNTRQMVEVQKMILGGGNLAAMGIATNDLSAMRGRRRRGPATDPALRQIGILVQTQALDVLGGANR